MKKCRPKQNYHSFQPIDFNGPKEHNLVNDCTVILPQVMNNWLHIIFGYHMMWRCTSHPCHQAHPAGSAGPRWACQLHWKCVAASTLATQVEQTLIHADFLVWFKVWGHYFCFFWILFLQRLTCLWGRSNQYKEPSSNLNERELQTWVKEKGKI